MDPQEYQKIKNPEALLFLEKAKTEKRRRRLIAIALLPASLLIWFLVEASAWQFFSIPWYKYQCQQVCEQRGYQECLVDIWAGKSRDKVRCSCKGQGGLTMESIYLTGSEK